MRCLRLTVITAAALMLAAVGRAQPIAVGSDVPRYETTGGVAGALSSVGSDTLNNVMTLWAESFHKLYPSVQIQIEGKGSSTAPPALIAGAAQLGPMSRPMKSSEIDQFEMRFGYKPTQIRVAVDALAVYINKDNPLERLTLQQIDAIFSKTRRGGLGTDISTWGQIGLDGDWESKPISIYGRNSASGTYAYFKKHALFKGDYKDTVKEQPGSASVVQGVTKDRYGIGYSGMGYKTSGVKTVRLAAKEGSSYYPAAPEAVFSGNYPLARFLYVYVNKTPNRQLDPLVREFMRFALSREGQEIVIKDGYLPLPGKIVNEERGAKLR